MALTTIANRLTPSVPIQLTFGAQPVATGTNFTTLFAHMATGATAQPYSVYTVINVGDPEAALAEVDALAGADSEAGNLAYAFVAANALSNGPSFPAFRICFLPSGETGFGPNGEALTAVQNLRNDMFVSPYPASNKTAGTQLLNFTTLISGTDRDLHGQFGSFMTVASLDPIATAVSGYDYNSRGVIIAYLQDTATTPVQSVGVVAAAHAARMMSSGQPYLGLNQVTIGGLSAPVSPSDWIQVDPAGQSEALLRAGLSPLYVQPGGTIGFVRTLTSVTTLADGVTPVTNYVEWQQLKILNDYREELFYVSEQPPFNNNPGCAKMTTDLVQGFKDRAISIAYQFEKANMFQNVKQLAPFFRAQVNTSSTGRFDIVLPNDVVPNLNVIAANIVATAYTGSTFTLTV